MERRASARRVSRLAASATLGIGASRLMSELWERDAWTLADDVRAGSLRARDVVEVHLERIERRNGELNAICNLDADGARRQADDVDGRGTAGEARGPVSRSA